MIPKLLACLPSDLGRYVEPFAGSACLFFAVKPKLAILGDFNFELMNTYRVIARHPRLVAREVSRYPIDDGTYYALRAQNPESLGDIERASRFMYLNRHCYNGVYRTNLKNQFNVPRGVRSGECPSEAEVYRCSLALRSATLIAGDFETTLAQVKSGDFVYLDPPYSSSSRPTYGEYGYGAFDRADCKRLFVLLRDLSARGVRVLFSYAEEPAVLNALRGWSIASISVRRQVAGGPGKKNVSEILASNFSDLRDLCKVTSAT
jgi:DNA adenine methylase